MKTNGENLQYEIEQYKIAQELRERINSMQEEVVKLINKRRSAIKNIATVYGMDYDAALDCQILDRVVYEVGIQQLNKKDE